MLTHLHIRHFAIIDDSELELAEGMTALTGETGAGKSILLDALGQVLGGRASSLTVQQGQSRAEITASFRLDDIPAVRTWLSAHELDDEDDCVLRRTVAASGKSRATINGTPVTLRMLGDLGEQLVAIHGQNARQQLGRPAAQRDLLDQWSRQTAAHATQLEKVQDAHASWHTADVAWREASDASSTRSQRIDLLRFQLQEFDTLDIGALTIEQIESEHRWLANVERVRSLGEDVLSALEGQASSALSTALKPLSELVGIDERLREALDLIESADIQVNEATSLLRHEVSALEQNESRLAWLDDKLAQLHSLAHKHRCESADLGSIEQALRDELDALDDPGISLDALARLRDDHEAHYLKAARVLSKRRQKSAASLADTVSEAMQTLAMEGGRFVIDVTSDDTRRSPEGIDTVSFQVSPNPGVDPAPLGRIASGGELSRIGLALQLATIGAKTVPTLIFDEVDAGVGGGVAETVGKLLRQVGGDAQVLCVTHLPQVASQAHHQLRVTKTVDDGQTGTRLEPLDTSARREEIARMLGGKTITKKSRQHAQEMLDAAGV